LHLYKSERDKREREEGERWVSVDEEVHVRAEREGTITGSIDGAWDRTISSTEYGMVRMMSIRSKRSTGIPWGESTSVPRTVQTPRLVAKITIGERDDSRARFRYVKHSMSSMWTWQRERAKRDGGGGRKVREIKRWGRERGPAPANAPHR